MQRVASQLDKRGTVDVLRRGVVPITEREDSAWPIFKTGPAGSTPELVERYEANILSVTRQLRYEPSKQQDHRPGTLFVNGDPGGERPS